MIPEHPNNCIKCDKEPDYDLKDGIHYLICFECKRHKKGFNYQNAVMKWNEENKKDV